MTFDEFMLEPVNAIYALTHNDLKIIKKSISKKNLDKLIYLAEEALIIPLQSVVYKEKVIIVKDKHDYESFSLYGWPDPEKKDGIPYIKKDGYVNPEHLKGDKLALRKMAYSVYMLGLLYYLTKEDKYYRRLKEHIMCFFINEETKMNPHLNHGQAMPGYNDGQQGAIIDLGISFGYSLAIIYALKQGGMLDNELISELEKWLKEFQGWLLTSKHGKNMDVSINNHAFVYDYILVIVSLFVNDVKTIEIVQQKFKIRLKEQIKEDGTMPQELKRTLSRSYYFMTMKLIFETAKFLNMNVQNYDLMKLIIEFYFKHNGNWPYTQVKPFNENFDNYMYYISKIDFKSSKLILYKSYKLQYYIFADVLSEV